MAAGNGNVAWRKKVFAQSEKHNSVVRATGKGTLVPVPDDPADAEMELRRRALMALCNLAASEANHPIMVEKGAIDVLLELANHRGDVFSERLRQAAAFALANFAANAANAHMLGKGGAVPPLIALAYTSEPNACALAIAALRRMAENPGVRRLMVELDVLLPLGQAGRAEEVATQRETAATLCNLSLNDENKVAIATSSALAPLVGLAQSSDLEVARQAVGAMANLAEDPSTHGPLRIVGGGAFLTGLVYHDDLDVHREASRAIANLLTSEENHEPIVRDGLPGVVQLAMSADYECQYVAARARALSRCWWSCALLLRCSPRLRQRPPPSLSRYHAALAIRKLAPNLASHHGIVSNGGLPALFFLVQARDVKTRRQAAVALRDLAANPENKARYVAEGGLRAMLPLARDASPLLQALGVAVWRHLSLESTIKRQLVEEGLLPALLRCATSRNWNLQCQCAGTLANLSENVANQISIVEAGGVPPLVFLGGVDNAEVQQDVARALANLCSNEENHIPVYEQGGLRCLVALTESPDPTTDRCVAARALVCVLPPPPAFASWVSLPARLIRRLTTVLSASLSFYMLRFLPFPPPQLLRDGSPIPLL